jgi:hypothetical protein
VNQDLKTIITLKKLPPTPKRGLKSMCLKKPLQGGRGAKHTEEHRAILRFT